MRCMCPSLPHACIPADLCRFDVVAGPPLGCHRRGHLAAAILALNAAGWGIFVFSVLPHDFRYARLGVGIGVAVTAWTLGLRHAFDADHISAIDNVTRKLMSDGQRPLGTGFFFALGHSTLMVAVGVAITFAAKAVFG